MRYAGRTASLSAQDASAPIPSRQKSRNFVSSSEGRLPYSRKNLGVSQGRITKTTTPTPRKIKVLIVNGANMRPRATTVPRSLMKQAASTVLPYSVTLNPYSNMTAYTTATEVVDIATPASQLGI